jgi:hypothetical protein
MEFACYTDWDQLPQSANALFEKAAKDSVFASRPWFENLVNHALEDGQTMLLACVVERDHVLAILPLMTRDSGHLHALGHLYTSLYTLLIAAHDQEDILTCLAQGLTQLPVCSLRLAPVAKDDSILQGLQKALESRGCSCFLSFRFFNWFHRLQGQAFADYMAARPSRVCNTIARKQRKLAREHGYDIRLYTGNGLQQAMADFNTVYSASWKAKELFGDFVDGLAERLSGRGWLRLAVLYIGGKPAAAQFWFVAHGKASIFKLAYDESWKRYSPGSILIHYLMKHVIDSDQVEEIDFLTGNDTYKQDWMSERRERWGLYCARKARSKGRVDQWLDLLKGWLPRLKQVDNHDRWFLNP